MSSKRMNAPPSSNSCKTERAALGTASSPNERSDIRGQRVVDRSSVPACRSAHAGYLLAFGTAIVAALQLMVNQTMSQPRCNMFRVAEDYIAKRYPFIDLAERHPVTSESNNVWEVRYELPQGTLGFVPVI